jgi:arylsulfatase A-like enzyme
MALTTLVRGGLALALSLSAVLGGVNRAAPSSSGGAQEADAAALTADRSSTRQPNIVYIVTDDQRFDELADMPAVHRTLIDRGMTLRRAYVVNSLCCPSRADFLKGAYSHTTGIYLNGDGGGPGGFPDFDDRSTLAVWLRQAGYKTALIGKYLNNYVPGTYVPPGWSFWGGLVGANSAYYDYDLSINGHLQHHGQHASDYATDVFARLAEGFIRRTPSERPLFLYFSPPAPHGPHTPPPRYMDAPTDPMPRYPSFNESDVTDKPAWVGRQPRLSSAQLATVRYQWSLKARTLMAVDDAVKGIVNALADTGRLQNTLFVLTSDNGLSMGEHRLRYKMNAYEESIRVPMIVRWDGHVPAGSSSMHLATNIDLAPTFAAVADAVVPRTVEGVSLLPLLQHKEAVRRSFLIEHQFQNRPEDPPTYCAIRTVKWKLVRYSGSAMELFHLTNDPWELHNLASRPSLRNTRRALMTKLRRLCDPLPPGMRPF